MAKPTGTVPPATPLTANYELPPLPPSPDESGSQTQQSTSGSAQKKLGQGEQQKQAALQSAQRRPQMKQGPGDGQTVSTRKRGGSMNSQMPAEVWESGLSPASSDGPGSAKSAASATTVTSVTSSTPLQSSGRPTVKLRSSGVNDAETGARARLGHARTASNPVKPIPVVQPQVPPLQVPPPADVPPPPNPTLSSKVPTLPLTKLTSVSAASTTPMTPTSTDRTKMGGALSGEEIKLELRYFIDGVLDGRIGVDHSNYAEQLGELLVYVESHGGAAPLSSTSHTNILRGGLRIQGYTRTSGGKLEDVNVITQFSQPFVKELLWKGESERVRQQIIHDFEKLEGKIAALNKEGEELPISVLLKHPEFLRLMKPLEDTFIDYVCGPERTLASSRLPDPVKQLLLSIDKHLIEWFEQCGTGKPKDLMALRTNALVGYLATRSVSVVWREHCGEDLGGGDLGAAKATERYARLFPHLNKVASYKFADLVMDIINTQPAQPKQTLEYVRAMQSPRQLVQKKVPAQKPAVSTHSVLQRGKTLNASSSLVSPRSSDTTNVSTAKATKEAERKLKEEKMRYQLERAKFADQIISKAGLKSLDSRFMQKLKEMIVDMSRRGFDNFRRDPILYCQRYATEFYAHGGNVQKAGKGMPDRVQDALGALRESFRQSVNANSDADTEASEEATVTTTTTAATTTTTTTTTTTKTRSDTTPRSTVSGEGANHAEESSDSSIIVSTPSLSRSDSSS